MVEMESPLVFFFIVSRRECEIPGVVGVVSEQEGLALAALPRGISQGFFGSHTAHTK